MRSLGSLIKGGYIPQQGEVYYQAYSEEPSLKFAGYVKNRRDKKFDFLPHSHDSLDKYYLHPYFPGTPLRGVDLLKPIPFFKSKSRIWLENGQLKFKEYIKLNEEAIYMFPTFFKPVY